MIIYNLLTSARLLGDAAESFNKNCVSGILPNEENIRHNLERSLMLITALNPHIGYDKAARAAKKALADGTTLKEAVLALGFLSEEEFDAYVVPEKMVGPIP